MKARNLQDIADFFDGKVTCLNSQAVVRGNSPSFHAIWLAREAVRDFTPGAEANPYRDWQRDMLTDNKVWCRITKEDGKVFLHMSEGMYKCLRSPNYVMFGLPQKEGYFTLAKTPSGRKVDTEKRTVRVLPGAVANLIGEGKHTPIELTENNVYHIPFRSEGEEE